MNKAEFKAWKAHTELSKTSWILDPVHNGQRGQNYLFHRGGKNGQFIEVYDGGLVVIGDYEGAYPHIGEAAFAPLYEKAFENSEEALQVLNSQADIPVLDAILEAV